MASDSPDLTMCTTVAELRDALAALPGDAPLAVLYDWGCGVQHGVAVRGVMEPEEDEWASGTVVLDIDPRPARHPMGSESDSLGASVTLPVIPPGTPVSGSIGLGTVGIFTLEGGGFTTGPVLADASESQVKAALESRSS
jgi:hypothetical protein